MNTQQIITRSSLYLLAWCTLAVASASAQTITHVPLFTFHGDSQNNYFGAAVSGAGDVNGDGFADLIVGASGAGSSAWVFSGVDGSVLYNLVGDSANDRFGGSVSGAGDVNGDGVADLIVGDGNDGVNSGSARVFSGADGSVLFNFDGDSANDGFGSASGAVSGAGDVNGDGFADLIVGASLVDNNSEDSGSARVFSGSDGSVLYNFDGDSAGDLFALSVSGAGDVNGDGFADLIVGAPIDDNNGENSGSARVFSGSDGSVLFNFDGDSATDRFGHSVSGAGDVNGDGFADLIVGAPSNARSFDRPAGNGSARVLSGVDGSVLYNFDTDSAGDLFGSSVSGAGDVNGDGFADLIVGASSTFHSFGTSAGNGSARVLSGVDGSVLYNFDNDFAGDLFGHSVSGAGDVNGDGVADFIVGAPEGGDNRYDFARNHGFARLFVSQITYKSGDCNLNGEVNFLDISPFIGILLTSSFLAEADCNQDGAVNFLDISPFIGILSGN